MIVFDKVFVFKLFLPALEGPCVAPASAVDGASDAAKMEEKYIKA